VVFDAQRRKPFAKPLVKIIKVAAMKLLCLVLILLTCGLAGGCVESTFCLSRGSLLPQGLRLDDEAQQIGPTASRVELWFYTYDPPTLKFFWGPDLVLSRQGSDTRCDGEGFFVQFNGVESRFRRVAYPNVVAVEERSDGTTPDGGLRATALDPSP
jgi:hypothetical protein